MSFIHNIQAVAKYESKLLLRSWFFRVFTALALFLLGIFNTGMLMIEENGGTWIIKALSANVPYANLLLLNTGQAVIAIFLASDFLKRDKKLDTSEVFYVHPLSNAEYVFGKLWGNLRAFLVLNLIVMSMALLFNTLSKGVSVDWQAYIFYFFIISIPTLIFIIGLSIFLMLIFRNQALTFILLLGYIGLTLFYIGDKFYYLFDYMAYSLPLLKSSIVGITNYGAIINHRAIYFFAGLAFIFFTIALFGRLPNSRRSSYFWTILGIGMLTISCLSGYRHIDAILEKENNRVRYTNINNTYVDTPKMVINQYEISFEQHPETFTATAEMKGIALRPSSIFAFCLNPGLQVTEVSQDDTPVTYSRDHQIILIDFGREIMQGDSVRLAITYSGYIDEDFCYLDIPGELLQEQHREMMINVDKKYVFQTTDYLLFTPETYWYPRPGIAFSNKSPGWQQTYFSHFSLHVKPLAGLTPFSQGKQTTHEDGQFSFKTDFPTQAISLTIGRYVQKSIVAADSIEYNLLYIEGHDIFSAALDSIKDTIPSIINEMRFNMQHQMKLTYPFKRFSVVEVPAQFFSYARTWSQAQETVQPEMVFYPEKGWTLDMDINRRWKNEIRWAKWSGRSIEETEAKMNAFRGYLYIFIQQENNFNLSTTNRARLNLTAQPNPYYLFPQFYNFRYNVFSPQWPVANRIIELYLQNKTDQQGWERDYNGISNNEKANLLMEEHSFSELLGDMKHKDLIDNLISLKASSLFAGSEINTGVSSFRDSVYAILARNTFCNVQFESLLDTLGIISQINIKSELERWNSPTPLPYYSFSLPEVNSINNKGKEVFVIKQLVTNDSDYDGIIQLNGMLNNFWSRPIDPKTTRKLIVPAHQSRLIVSVWDEAPMELWINTLTSGNLPSAIQFPIRNINRDTNKPVDAEGDFAVSISSYQTPNEVIVDNEDSLFDLSKPIVTGILPKLLDKIEDSGFKYQGVIPWWPPLQWTATTNTGYYGKYVRSAYVIKSGDGSQTATWKIPVEAPGQYEIYYWTFSNETRYQYDSKGEYHFKIEYGKETEDAYLNIGNSTTQWEQLGVYYVESDTVRVTLSNECKLRTVTADAVKLVKRQ